MVSSSGETVWESSSSGKDKDKTLLMSCTGLDDTSGSGSIRATDCINGSLVQGSFLEGVSNYTQVMKVFNTLGRHPKADPRSNQQINFYSGPPLLTTHHCSCSWGDQPLSSASKKDQ